MKTKAYAKINLFLEITGKRKDGYHNLVSVMQEINVYDDLVITKNTTGVISLDVRGMDSVPHNETNLVYKAAQLLQKRYRVPLGAHIVLTKHIPTGAGLGGGSSDAAHTLVVLNTLWKLNLSRHQLATLGTHIGADVPFFVYGGRCLVQGIGDKITPLAHTKKMWVVIVYPNIHLSTKLVYNKLGFTLTKKIKKCSILPFPVLFQQISRGEIPFFNRLEAASFSLVPVLKTIKEMLQSHPRVMIALMTGSGSAFFAVVDTKQAGYSVRRAMQRQGYAAWVVRTN